MTKLEQASDPNTPADVLIDIISDARRGPQFGDSWGASSIAARHRNLPASVVEEIAKNGCSSIKYDAAMNPNMSQSAFELFAQNKSLWGNLVLNPSTPLHFLIRVVREGYLRDWQHCNNADICNVARSLRAPISILMELAKDPHPMVRADLTQNPNTPEWLLWQLAADQDAQVRCYVCYRPNLPLNLYIQLAQREENTTVLEWMSDSPHTPIKMKVWLQSYRDSMSLEEFLEATK